MCKNGKFTSKIPSISCLFTIFIYFLGSIVACDPTLFGAKTWIDMREKLEKSNITFKSLTENLIDQVWTEENGRPPMEVQIDFTKNLVKF